MNTPTSVSSTAYISSTSMPPSPAISIPPLPSPEQPMTYNPILFMLSLMAFLSFLRHSK